MNRPKLDKFELRLLFAAYRAGYYPILWQRYPVNAPIRIAALCKQGLLRQIRTSEDKTLITVTDTGAVIVEDSFVKALTSSRLWQIEPLLMIRDRVRVTQTLTNGDTSGTQYVKGGQTSIPKGMYFIGAVDQFSVLLVSEETNQKYRVRMAQASNFLQLQFDAFTTMEKEFKRRVGKIPMKALARNLSYWETDNLKLLELITSLKKSKVAKGRLNYDSLEKRHV
jgi:hypothetical protein